MNKFSGILASGLLAFGLTGTAEASSVFLVGDSNVFTTQEDNEVLFQNVFNGQSVLNASDKSLSGLGTTATVTDGVISAANLAGKSFLMAGFNVSSYSAIQLSAITSFVTGGGSLFLIGEGNPFYTGVNRGVNNILAAAGSSMRLSETTNLDNQDFTVLTSLVTDTSFTDGVNSWITAYTSSIELGADGQAIVSGIADAGIFGTAVGYENLAAVPVPAAGILLMGALGSLGAVSRRRKNRKAT